MVLRKIYAGVYLALAVGAASGMGCTQGFMGGHPGWTVANIPIPLSPYFQDRKEDEAWMQERYNRVPILGPVTAGGPPRALDPPSQDEIMRALPSIEGGIPFLWSKQRDNVRMVVEPIADYVDAPRHYPLIGPAQLHHAHYKCTVYYSETTHVGYPVPHTTRDEDSVQVVYIDHNHLHMVGNVDGGGGNY